MQWTGDALAALKSGLPWELFTRKYPGFTYDAWECKRRRVVPAFDPVVIPEVPAGLYVGPTISFWDLETTYSSQPRILSGAGMDGFGALKLFDQREYSTPDAWIDDHDIAVAIRDYLEDFAIIAGECLEAFSLLRAA